MMKHFARKDQINFDLIVIIQSYPNLISTINYVLSYGDKDI